VVVAVTRYISDLTGDDIAEKQHVKLVIRRHPAYVSPVTLDAQESELEALKTVDEIVELEIQPTGSNESAARTLLVELSAPKELAKGENVDTILMNAAAAQARPSEPKPRTRRGGGTGAQRAKVNYATLEHAGEPHRGRITDAEKEIVRNNLAKINKRLRDSGKRQIDPTDPEMQQRYGLSA
jgi:hypothetical protein